MQLSADLAMQGRLFWGFTLASLLLFGFIAWKPHVWVSLSPFKTHDRPRLVAIYRLLAAIVLVGILVNVILRLTLWEG